MKLEKLAGATSEIWQIFIKDSTSTTGAGLTGLTNSSAGLTAYYHRDTDTTATVMSLVTMTVGTFTSLGFKEIDSTNMPGWYQFCPPNAALASGAKSCAFHLKGATNMVPLPIEVQLVSYNPDDAVHLGLSCLPNTAVTTNGSLITSGTGADQLHVNGAGKVSEVVLVDTLTTYTGDTPQTGDSFARLGAPAGASIAADIAEIEGETDSLLTGMIIRTGTAQAGAAGSITLDSGASATDNLYRDEEVVIVSGTGAGQTRLIIGYTGSSKIAAVSPNWITNPDNTSVFNVQPGTNIAALGSAGLDNIVIETGYNARQALALILAAEGGTLSGSGTTTVTIKNAGGSTSRIVGTVDSSGNRSAVTLTPPT